MTEEAFDKQTIDKLVDFLLKSHRSSIAALEDKIRIKEVNNSKFSFLDRARNPLGHAYFIDTKRYKGVPLEVEHNARIEHGLKALDTNEITEVYTSRLIAIFPSVIRTFYVIDVTFSSYTADLVFIIVLTYNSTY